MVVFGKELYGTGSDHSRFDVYVNNTLWQSFDGYAAASGEAAASLVLTEEGWHVFEIRNTHDKTAAATNYKIQFKSLSATSRDFVQQDIAYTYDDLSRLLTANYNGGDTIYAYLYDVAGNRRSEALSGASVTAELTEYEYNAANQLQRNRVDGGAWVNFTYDANGNLTSDGANSYTWDRANRMMTAGTTSYQYNGAGNRIQQSVGGVATKYLLDLQPGLAVALAQTTNGQTTRFVHAPTGIYAHEDPAGNWVYTGQDGLGSVLNEVNAAGAVQFGRQLDPYGKLLSSQGTTVSPYEYTGEMKDSIGLLHLRARNYAPSLGVFASLDLFEGKFDEPLSLNSYGYVSGNPVNQVDPSGLCWANTSISADKQSQCYDGWLAYISVINETYTQNWPRAVQILMTQEARYWSNLPYNQFVIQWNGVRPPASNNPGGEILAMGVPLAATTSSVNPFPGPEDVAAFGIALCVTGLAILAAATTTITLPLRPQINFAKRSGERISWESNFQAAKDALGACIACGTAALLNPKFCKVNVVSGHGQPGHHFHIFKFHQDGSCYCRIQPDDPYVKPLASDYAGPPGGPHFPLTTPPINPELSICTGGWMQT